MCLGISKELDIKEFFKCFISLSQNLAIFFIIYFLLLDIMFYTLLL